MKRFRFVATLAIFLVNVSGGTASSAEQEVANLEEKSEVSDVADPALAAEKPGAVEKRKVDPQAAGQYGRGHGLRATYAACMARQPDGMSTAGHRQDCADRELEFQDARLNRAYRQVMNALEARGDRGKAASTRLRQAQRRWLSRLDATCGEAAENAGSTMGPAAQSTCLMDSTAMRADALERMDVDAAGR